MSRHPIIGSVILMAAVLALGQVGMRAESGCIDRGYGETSYCPPNPAHESVPAPKADKGNACLDRGYGESAYCPTEPPAQPAPVAPTPRCLDRGYGEDSSCSPD